MFIDHILRSKFNKRKNVCLNLLFYRYLHFIVKFSLKIGIFINLTDYSENP